MISKCSLPPNTSGGGRKSLQQVQRSGHLRARCPEPLGQGWPEGVGRVPSRWACPGAGGGPGRVEASPCPGGASPAPRPGFLFQGYRGVTAQTWRPPLPHPLRLGDICVKWKNDPKGAGPGPSRAVCRAASPLRKERDAKGQYTQNRATERAQDRGPGLTAPRPLANASAPGAQPRGEKDRLCPSAPEGLPRPGHQDPAPAN